VVAREFSLTLSRTGLAPGTAIIELVNAGEDPHNLRIARADGTGPAPEIPETPPGQDPPPSVTMTLTPGSYSLVCTLADHTALGMSATLRVE